MTRSALPPSPFPLTPSLINRLPPIGCWRVLILRFTTFALVVLRNERRTQVWWADMTPQQNQRVRAAPRTLSDVADGASFFERMADRKIHQTIRLTRFHPTNISDAAASHHRRRTYQGFAESSSR